MNEHEEIEKSIIVSLMKSALASGEIDTSGLTKEEVEAKCMEHLKKLADSEEEWEFIIDHRPDLIKQAKEYFDSGQYELSTVLYAMWLEHWINGIYQQICYRKGLSNSDYKEMIRSLNMRAKTGWFLKMLDLPPLDNEMLKIFNKVIESRNSFVHYKWQPQGDLSREERLKSERDSLEEIDTLIGYLVEYETDNVFYGHQLERV
ncbi:TPA: hypothetical protein ACN36G_004475 [Vibrio parahaemolyticus]|uniref:hypothetical protein n=1 Tax=Vibrio harveyi TaxID=669 RepID=UPI002985E8C3|nr:hypothetical protein [Vibrio harveyi]